MKHALKGAVAAAALAFAPVAIAQEQENTAPQTTTVQPTPEVTIEQDITVQPQNQTVQPQNQTTQPAQDPQPANAQVAEGNTAECAEMTIYFDSNADAVMKEKEAEVAKKAEVCKAEQVRVVGYTDEAGDADYNKMLGERRAESVKAMLVAMGVPAENIMVESKGEEEATGDASKDRKVEVEFEVASNEAADENAG